MPLSRSQKSPRSIVRLQRLPRRVWEFLTVFVSHITHPSRYFDNWLTDYLNRLGFANINRHIVYGPTDRLHLDQVRPMNNTLFNTRSGHIYIGRGTVFGYNCMFLTGVHLFEDGKLKQPKSMQVPTEGYDIRVGQGCWITSGATIIGGVTLGDHCLVAAGAVVTKDFPDGVIVGGVPARMIGYTADLPRKKSFSAAREAEVLIEVSALAGEQGEE